MNTLKGAKKKCTICGSANLFPKWRVNSYSISKCAACTAMMVTNPPTLDELSKYYTGVSDPGYYANNRNQLLYYYKKLAKQIKGIMPHGKKIFDVGCSMGYFFEAMSGWECHGNELNEFEAKEAQKSHGDNIIQGPFETIDEPQEKFDVVTIQDVLDHFIDPVAVVQKANKMLKDGGLLVIKVHDYDCLYAKLSGKKFYAVIPPVHLTFLNLKSLKNICSKTGFRLIKHCHMAQVITIPTILFRLSQFGQNKIFFKAYKFLESTFLKKITLKKNLHDIITIFAIKDAGC